MQPISITDPAWRTTFPHVVAPLPDEWLGGLLLRCDDVNHWKSGATVNYVFGMHLSHQVPRLIVSNSSNLQYLAQLLAIPENVLLVTTFRAELTRIFDTPNPLSKYLGKAVWYKICPACIAQDQILRRTHVLPEIKLCQYHHIELLSRCRCGSYLDLFPRHALPFTCQKCGLNWAKLPRIPAALKRIVLEQKYLSLYEFFFSKGTPALVACASWLYNYRREEQLGRFIFPFEGSYKARIQSSWEEAGPPRPSLAITIESLVLEDISPHDIMNILPNSLQESESTK